MQELIRRGIIAPSFVVSFSHSDADIEHTAEAVYEAHAYIARRWTRESRITWKGRPVKPVNRKLQLAAVEESLRVCMKEELQQN